MFSQIKTAFKVFVIFTTALTGVVFALPAHAAGSMATAIPVSTAAEHSYTIQLHSGQKADLLSQLPGLTNIQPVDGLPDTYRFNSTENLSDLRRTFDGFYLYLNDDSSIQIDATSTSKIFKSNLPNDPGFTDNASNVDRQWGLVKADFIQAWKKTTGDRNVVVAIVDTGVDGTHEDLLDSHFVLGYNVLTEKTIPIHTDSDDNGHGTLIAGVIAATTDNDLGIAGASFNVSIMPVKALDAKGVGSSSAIAEGIMWATDHGADVINMSLGGLGFAHDTVLADAITYAFNHNVVVVSAAGNDVAVTGGNLDKDPVFPICDDNGQNMIIGVTATDVNDQKPDFANFGKACIDVSAPGKRILSTINHDPATGAVAPDAYAYASGTSLAVPFVSAEASLLRSLFPDATNRQVRNRILSTAENIDALNPIQCGGVSCAGLLGGGRIDAERSLEEQISTLKDGDMVRIKNTNIYYLINGGKKQLISQFVRSQRFAKVTPILVDNADLADFPEGSYAEPLDGTLVKNTTDPTVYYMLSGLRRPVTYQVFTARGLNFVNVVSLSNTEVSSWIVGSFLTPPDGTLMRGIKNPTVYWVISGTLHPVNYKFYTDRGLSIFPLTFFPDNDINKFPQGDAYILN